MIVRLFDLKESLPMSQGMAFQEIQRNTAGALESAGEVIIGGPSQGSYLYVKKTYSDGEVKTSESLWLDDGLSLACVFQRPDDQPWQRKQAGEWITVGLELEFVDLAGARKALGVPG